MNQYLGPLGLPSGRALRASVGLACAGGTMARAAEAGAEVMIVSAPASEGRSARHPARSGRSPTVY